MSICVPSDEAIELFDALKNALGLPDGMVSMSLHMADDSLVTVECKYYPAATGAEGLKALKMLGGKFNLVAAEAKPQD
jgi:hypothetical protein